MVHLVISVAAIQPALTFRIVQVDQYPEMAQEHQVKQAPTLVIPGQAPHEGNLPSQHVLYYLWQAASGLP